MRRRIFLTLLALVLFLSLFYSKPKSDFLLYQIPKKMPFHQEWEVPPFEGLQTILSQQFTYLSEGHQCFVFQSADEKYVLKFPFHISTRPPLWLRFFPFFAAKYRDKKMLQKQKKMAKHSTSYSLAFEELKEETGLIYIHFNRTNHLNQSVSVVDQKGVKYQIDLDKVEFLLQKKVDLLYPRIKQWVANQQVAEAKEGLSRLVSLLHHRYAKGIEDKEKVLEGNFGFLESQPVQIDIGRLEKTQPLENCAQKEEITRLLFPLKEQLKSEYPEIGHHLEKELEALPS